MCLILHDDRYRAVRIYEYERIVNNNKEKLHNVIVMCAGPCIIVITEE